MLKRLEIRNLALVQKLELEFAAGLNLITGETGAGKSILIDALGFALGQRSSVSLIRSGEERCQVQAVFELMDGNLAQWNELLEKKGLPESDGELWLKRELNSKGRGRAWINGEAAPLATLAKISSHLVDFHGQHENQSLMRPFTHQKLLDKFASIEKQVELCKTRYGLWQKISQRRQAAWMSEEEKLRRLDMLRFQVKELEEAALRKGEWASLKEQRIMAASAEKRAKLAHELDGVLHGSPGSAGAKEGLETALGVLRQLAALDTGAADELVSLENAVSEVQELSLALREYSAALDYDPAQLERDETRLAQLENLSRKYGENEEGMLAFFEKASSELQMLENQETERGRLEKEEQKAREAWLVEAAQISKARNKAAQKLGQALAVSLTDLGMPKAVFDVWVQTPVAPEEIDTAAGPEGYNRVEFLLSANPGQPPKALGKAASGGEISRVMLALKTVLVNVDPVDTLVFDEIDSGVSGRVAQAVGENLSKLAARRQVFVITHLPQVASRPAKHFLVSKGSEGGSTFTQVRSLNEEKRVQEVAALIGGKAPTTSGLNHARQLLAGAKKNG